MSKTALRKKISNLLDNVPDGEVIEIYYTNPATGETKLIFQSPAAKGLQIEVDDPKTGETYLKLSGRKP